MKKIKFLIASAIASAFVFFGGAVAPVAAFADEPTNEDISSEIVSVGEFAEETESVENLPVETPKNEENKTSEKTKLTYEDILAITGEIMEQEGFKNKWDKALFHIETAASKKNVEILIALVGILIALFVGYISIKIGIWKVKHKNDTTSKDVKDIKEASGQQTTAINALIDEEEKMDEHVTESIKREKLLAEGITKQNVAMRCLLRGTNIRVDLKEEAFRALNESDELCDKAKK